MACCAAGPPPGAGGAATVAGDVPLASPPLRVVEFFAGMGGMRAAGEVCGLPMEVVAAYEISEICQKAYCHNYGKQSWILRTIESLATEELEAHRADVWLMSPPCQPFTRSGRSRDHEDNRTLGLLHLIQVLREMKHRPRWLLLENVVGFERSESRRRLLAALAEVGFEGAEFGLDSQDFGVPNRRPRYYGLFRSADAANEPDQSVSCYWQPAAAILQGDDPDSSPLLHGVPWEVEPAAELGEMLQAEDDIAKEEAFLGSSLEVPQEVMQERADNGKYDLHLRSDRTSACLTKVNGRLPRGYSTLVVVNEDEAGALEQRPKVRSQGVGPGLSTDHVWRPGVRVRYLSPAEQLRLMGYPESYAFPKGLGFKEISSLMGNSLNVGVVAWLLPLLILGRARARPALPGRPGRC